MNQPGKWPKHPPALTPAQLAAREEFMALWHEQLPSKYGVIERFNHGHVASLPRAGGTRTLEIGAGIGGHLPYENLGDQEYHVLEFRSEFCRELERLLPEGRVHCGDIQVRQPFPDAHFGRVVAIHVLEHLPDLPSALDEITRILSPGGIFDVVLPCEGGLAHTLARKISAERLFRKHFDMDFEPIHRNEHVNTFDEVHQLLKARFRVVGTRYFPLRLPAVNLNLAVALRLAPIRRLS